MKKQITKMQIGEAGHSRKTSSLQAVAESGKKLGQALAGMSDEQVQALNAYHPATRAVASGNAFTKSITGEVDIFACVSVLMEQINEVKSGNLSCAEATLTAQANTLDLIFNSLAKKAANSDTLNHYETFLRLALKAQSQCRTTYETLAEIKSPRPLAFIKQQNIGVNQQVNNDATHAHEKIVNPSNELLEVQHGERLDPRTTDASSGTYKDLETVGAINRRQDAGR